MERLNLTSSLESQYALADDCYSQYGQCLIQLTKGHHSLDEPKPINIQHRVTVRSGLIPALMGESQGKAFERALPVLNDQGYRVVFMVKDHWNPFKWFFLTLLLAMVTFGLY